MKTFNPITRSINMLKSNVSVQQKDNPHSIYWRKRADAAWSNIIKHTGRCAYCGAIATYVGLEAHHLIPRRNTTTRHLIECGLCLCSYHHLYCPKISPHLKPKMFVKWLKENRPNQYRWVVRNNKPFNPSNNICKPDYQSIYKKLLHYTKHLII